MERPDQPLPPPPPPLDPGGPPSRTVQKIVLEAAMTGLIGLTILGICWEVGQLDVGWVLAIIVWVAGPAVLELLQRRAPRRGGG